MKKRIRYSDEPIGPVEIVPDFLPPPEELAREDDGVKVTLSLSRRSVEFFKARGADGRTFSYQRMIRRLRRFLCKLGIAQGHARASDLPAAANRHAP